MILEQLTLRNFGLFHGKQVIDLAPVERNGKRRPIVLFGGLNGGGKTTLFDAVQLALYGPRARCSKRASLGYSDFLLQCIHHGISPEEGAGVWLSFRYASEGELHDYEVRRNWQVQDGKLRESLLVFQDGLPNNSLSTNWAQVVEELIPLEISQVFFFDGEKIRSLAEDASSSQALGVAVKALLGLDIVERLIADSAVLQTRLGRQAGTPESRAEVEELEGRGRAGRAEVARLHAEHASLQNDYERAENRRKETLAAFAAAGGRHWQARQEREQGLAQLKTLIDHMAGRLLEMAAGELPLALVPELLEAVEQQADRERRAGEDEIMQRLLVRRDAQLLEVLREARATARLIQKVEEYLAADRRERTAPEAPGHRLDLSTSARSLLAQLRERRLAAVGDETRRLLIQLGQAVQESDDLDRALASTPDEEAIKQVVEDFETAAQEAAVLEERSRRLEGELTAQRDELREWETKLERLLLGQVEKEFAHEDSRRMMQLAGRTKGTMERFLEKATASKIDRLSALITESFRYLLRKQTLIDRIVIDPGTFDVTLYDDEGSAVPRHRLSEGEKQIFAIAMLWGLARAAARPLPTMIDTPMARLDSAHRRHLVERYFPNASHQVVIFSTDTEVDRPYYQALGPSVARAYHLDYDEAAKVAVAREGYFWRD
jgi:DNA sulfur modification protein DndD